MQDQQKEGHVPKAHGKRPVQECTFQNKKMVKKKDNHQEPNSQWHGVMANVLSAVKHSERETIQEIS